MDDRVQGGRGADTSTSDGFPCLTDRAALSELFLRRLKRVLLLRFYTNTLLSPGDLRLLDLAICSSYGDCQLANAGDEAQRMIAEARAGVGYFRRPAPPENGWRPWSI